MRGRASSSHAHVGRSSWSSRSTRGQPDETVLYNKNGQSPCAMCTSVKGPCTTGSISQRDDPPTPSECTCNNVFFNLWSACLLSESNNSTRPLYSNWTMECQQNSVEVIGGYPERWSKDVEIPAWARIEVPDNGTFNITHALQVAQPEHWSMAQIITPVVGVLGAFLLGAAFFGYFRTRRGRTGGAFSNLIRRLRPHKVHKVQPRKGSIFSIDHTELGDDDYVVIDFEDTERSHSRHPSSETLHGGEAEYHIPFRNIWRTSKIAQQFRRLPNTIPIPFKERAVHVKSQRPGSRFRVDPVGNSRSGTTEGNLDRPDTSYKDDEYPEAGDLNSVYDEETSLITPVERNVNSVFLITNRHGDFSTEESGGGGSSSRNSHQVKVVPPTPTDSSRLSHQIPQMPPPPPPTLNISRRPEVSIPPPPRQPAPFPPPSSSSIPKFNAEQRHRPSQQVPPPPPPVPSNPNLRHPYSPPVHIPRLPPLAESTPRPPQTGRTNRPSTPHRQGSFDDDDHSSISSSRRHRPAPPNRPMGARAPTSPHHLPRQLSLDEELFGPTIKSAPVEPARVGSPSLYPQPPSHHRAFSDGDDHAPWVTLAPLRPMHSRNMSDESIVPARGDPIMLFPGSVRAVGYTVNLPSEANTSSASLYSAPSARRAR